MLSQDSIEKQTTKNDQRCKSISYNVSRYSKIPVLVIRGVNFPFGLKINRKILMTHFAIEHNFSDNNIPNANLTACIIKYKYCVVILVYL